MRTYRDKQAGFEVDLPSDWSLPTQGTWQDISCQPDEGVDFLVGVHPPTHPEFIERQFEELAHSKGYVGLTVGRIAAAGGEHVWARFQMSGGRWAKKYVLVFGPTHYFLTFSAQSRSTLVRREPVWDALVRSFRLTPSAGEEMRALEMHRRRVAGDSYERAFEAVGRGDYLLARTLLERCLSESPDHVLAHKEMAVVLKALHDYRSAVAHRKEVRRLDPNDKINRYNLADLLATLGEKAEALREIEALLKLDPTDQLFRAAKAALVGVPLTYPQYYLEELQKHPGEKRRFRLQQAVGPILLGHALILLYSWEEGMTAEEAAKLMPRLVAYVCCAIYDVAKGALLACQPSPIANGLRPAWLLEGEQAPVSLTLSDIDEDERYYQLSIGPIVSWSGRTPNPATWERLRTAFEAKLGDICV